MYRRLGFSLWRASRPSERNVKHKDPLLYQARAHAQPRQPSRYGPLFVMTASLEHQGLDYEMDPDAYKIPASALITSIGSFVAFEVLRRGCLFREV